MSGTDRVAVDKNVLQTYWELDLRSDGIVWLSRRRVSYPSLDDLHRSYDTFLRVVDDWLFDRRIKSGQLGTRTRTPMAWLTDMRNAPDLRNDPEFESAVKARRPDLLERSEALAILVNTNAGQMQLRRITNEKGVQLGVFNDPEETVAWLTKRMGKVFT